MTSTPRRVFRSVRDPLRILVEDGAQVDPVGIVITDMDHEAQVLRKRKGGHGEGTLAQADPRRRHACRVPLRATERYATANEPSDGSATEVAEEESCALLACLPLDLHRIHLGGVVGDHGRSARIGGDAHRISLLTEALVGGVLDERRNVLPHPAILEASEFLVDDLLHAIPTQRREALSQSFDHVLDRVVLNRITHACIVRRLPASGNGRPVTKA